MDYPTNFENCYFSDLDHYSNIKFGKQLVHIFGDQLLKLLPAGQSEPKQAGIGVEVATVRNASPALQAIPKDSS